MTKPANDNRIQTMERKLHILQHMIEQMQEDLVTPKGRGRARC
jgi:hypothetical protein